MASRFAFYKQIPNDPTEFKHSITMGGLTGWQIVDSLSDPHPDVAIDFDELKSFLETKHVEKLAIKEAKKNA